MRTFNLIYNTPLVEFRHFLFFFVLSLSCKSGFLFHAGGTFGIAISYCLHLKCSAANKKICWQRKSSQQNTKTSICRDDVSFFRLSNLPRHYEDSFIVKTVANYKKRLKMPWQQSTIDKNAVVYNTVRCSDISKCVAESQNDNDRMTACRCQWLQWAVLADIKNCS